MPETLRGTESKDAQEMQQDPFLQMMEAKGFNKKTL